MGAVRDTLISAREASQELSRLRQQHQFLQDAIGVQGHSYGVHSKSGILDPMRRVVDLIEWEEDNSDLEELQDVIEEGKLLIDGAAILTDAFTLDVLQRYYLRGQGLPRIARELAPGVPGLDRLPEATQVAVLEDALANVVADLDRTGEARLKALAR